MLFLTGKNGKVNRKDVTIKFNKLARLIILSNNQTLVKRLIVEKIFHKIEAVLKSNNQSGDKNKRTGGG